MVMEEGEEVVAGGSQIMKGKRSKRHKLSTPPSSPETVVFSSSSGNSSSSYAMNLNGSARLVIEEDDEDMANCLILLAQGGRRKDNDDLFVTVPPPAVSKNSPEIEVYQCKTCERCFPSFQALGGHRASHKKPKITHENDETIPVKKMMTAINEDETLHHRRADGYLPQRNTQKNSTNTNLTLRIPINSIRGVDNSTTKAIKVHECSICGAEFSSGQALGGHMRRHRPFRSTPVTTTTTTTALRLGHSTGREEFHEARKPNTLNLELDLNLPAEPEDDVDQTYHFSSKEQVIVFSASPLVDCPY